MGRHPRTDHLLGAPAAALLPILLFAGLCGLSLHSRGPSWVGTRSDPGYVYLFSSLSLVQARDPGHADHPGGTVQRIGEAVLRSSSGPAYELVRHTVARPERALERISLALALVVGGLVLASASWMTARGCRPAEVLAACGLPMLSAASFSELMTVKPEPLILGLLIMFGAAWLVAAHGPRPSDGYLLGFAMGMAVATKWVALIGLPLLLAVPHPRRWVLRFLLAAMGSFALATAHLGHQISGSFGFLLRMAFRSGRYGSGPHGVPEYRDWIENAGRLARFDPVLALLIAIAFCWLLAEWSKGGLAETPGSGAVIGISVATLAIGFVVLAKRYEPRDLVPLAALSGLPFACRARRPPLPTSRRVRRNVMVLALAPALALTSWSNENVRDRWRAVDQRAVELDRTAAQLGAEGCMLLLYGASSQDYALWLGNHQSRNYFRDVLTDRRSRVLNYWDERIETIGGEVLAPPLEGCAAIFLRGRFPREQSRRSCLLRTLQKYGAVAPSVRHLKLASRDCRGECVARVATDGALVFPDPAPAGSSD